MTVVNLGDSGVSTFSTTGSIGAASNSLTVADASGFAINDYLIIEIGGEAGAGARGTAGVGGTWPNLSYATVAAMNADTGQPDGQYAYVVASGDVYRSFSGVWSQQPDAQDTYYIAKVIPRALAAQITNKVGNVLTLDTAATSASTNANVYFDNVHIITAVTESGSGVADNSEIILPSGRYAISVHISLADHNNWDFHGTNSSASTLFFPEGISGLGIFAGSGNNNLIIRDLALEGNARSQGYMIYFLPANETVAWYNEGIRFATSPNMTVYNILATDCFKTISYQDGCDGSLAHSFQSILTEGVWVEAWQISGNDCDSLVFRDFTMTAATWTPGPEFFRCTNSQMLRGTTTNAFWSMNTCNEFLMQDISATIVGAQQGSLSVFTVGTPPVVNINANIGGAAVASGGIIRNISITQNGTAGAGNDTMPGITVDVNTPFIRIEHATIFLPNYVSGSSLNGAVGVNSDGVNTTVSHLYCHGTTNPSNYRNLMFSNTGGIYRCVSIDTVVGGTEIPCDERTVKAFGSGNTMRFKKGRR